MSALPFATMESAPQRTHLAGRERGLDVGILQVGVDLGWSVAATKNSPGTALPSDCAEMHQARERARWWRSESAAAFFFAVSVFGVKSDLIAGPFAAVAAHVRRRAAASFFSFTMPSRRGMTLLERARLVGDLELEERRLLHDVGGAALVVDARELDDDAVGADLLHHRLGDAELVDARADDLERAIERLALVLDGALRLVDREREVHAALQVEPLLEGNPLDRVGHERRRCGGCARSTVRGKSAQLTRRQSAKIASQPILQVRHSEAGEEVVVMTVLQKP